MNHRAQATTLFFRGQNAYPHGTHMCTTTCMHVAVAALCKRLDLAANPPAHILKSRIDSIMQVASRSQAAFEASCRDLPRMLSIHEIMLECSINLPKLGLQSQELVVVSGSRFLASSSSECCLIGAGDLPLRLSEKGAPCAATATGNGHTVCLIHYGQGKFAMFDSAPGLLAWNLDAKALLKRLDAALGTSLSTQPPDAAASLHGSTCSSSMQCLYRKGRKMLADRGEEAGRKKQKILPDGSNRSSSFGDAAEQQQQQQCDITLFWKQ